MTTITINPLDPDQFYAQNVTWVTQSSKILESTDATSLHLDIGRRAMDARRALFALTKNGRDLTNSEREQRKELHHTMQVCVPAFRRSLALQRNLHAGNHKATRKAAADPALPEALEKLNLGFSYLDAPEFGAAMKRDHEFFKELVPKLGIRS